MDGFHIRRRTASPRIVLLLGLALAAGLGLGVHHWLQQPASGADEDGTPDAYRVVGDGELPTTRPRLGAPRDALSPEEVGYAIHLASTDSSVPETARDVSGAAGPEVLLTGLPDDPALDRRVAVVTLYDYATDVGYQQRVDLASGAVSSQHAAGLQTTISPTEAEVATQIAIDGGSRLRFLAEFQSAQGTPLLAPEQVRYAAGTFRYDGSTPGGRACGRQRCAQLLLRLPSGAYLDTSEFVVNLSTRAVVRLDAEADR